MLIEPAELRDWLLRASLVLAALAADGLAVDGYETPADLMTALAERLSLDDWDAVATALLPPDMRG